MILFLCIVTSFLILCEFLASFVRNIHNPKNSLADIFSIMMLSGFIAVIQAGTVWILYVRMSP